MAASTVAVEELRVGMFIQLDGGWLSHPFPLSSFRISSPEQIATLRGLGLARLRWVPEKSDLAASEGDSAAAALAASQQERASALRRRLLVAQREAAQRCEHQHGEAAQAWRAASDALASQPRDAGRSTEQLARAILDKMLVGDEILIRVVTGGGDRAAAHALNVSVIALLIGRSLGLAEPELVDLGVGALMHDVGKAELAERFRHVEDGFSASELAAYRDHVVRSVNLGQRMALSVGAMKVLAQHHEHADGSGFPLKLAGERITLAARVVSLVDRYDNLCNPQARTLALTPHEAVSVLFAQGRNRYDATVLNAFIRMMGVYPAGSLVQLTDDRYAMVLGVNASRPLKPRVLVHEPRVPKDEATVIDLEQLPDLGIRRSLSAAKLPPAAVEYLDPRSRVTYFFEPLAKVAQPEMAA